MPLLIIFKGMHMLFSKTCRYLTVLKKGHFIVPSVFHFYCEKNFNAPTKVLLNLTCPEYFLHILPGVIAVLKCCQTKKNKFFDVDKKCPFTINKKRKGTVLHCRKRPF